jgi:tetratricopeptide (TPR) repeat protein
VPILEGPDEPTPDVEVTCADGSGPSVATALAGAELPARIGRYLVLGRIGQGGMGIVVAGYDARLDRAVAIKLLHPLSRGLNAGPRLVREAQALARLSHPNVVEIYDAGTIDGHPFVAMELVHGQTLKGWLAAARRDWHDVRAMFTGAAAGLVAAHRAGIVHRDFKPDNVLVGGDGRPRVVDFGLALGRGEASDDAHAAIADPSASMLATRLTATGLVVGTPAYMAPEQLRGEAADAASDQYSFCVAMFEAMFGERPRYDTSDTRRALPPLRTTTPPAQAAPMWLRRVLQRGLALAPSERWPSMEALVDALSPRPRGSRRASVLTLGALVAGVLAWRSASGDARDRCERDQARVAALWDDVARDRVQGAMQATQLGYADEAWARVDPELSAYVHEAAALRGATCESATERARECLDHREAALAAVVEVLAQSDRESLARATAVAAGLPRIDVCSDPEALADELPLPTAPADREDATQIREALLTVVALRDARRFADGIALAEELSVRARELGYRPVIAEAQLALGSLRELVGDDVRAEGELVEAAMTAKAEGLDRVAAIAMTRLVGAVGYKLARVEEGRAWARHAEAMTQRARLVRAEEATLRNNLGAVEFRVGDYARAEEIYREVIALVGEPRDIAERQELAHARSNLGNVLARQGRFDEATTELEQGLALLTDLLGPDHPTVAMALINLGNLQYDFGDYLGAGVYHRRAYVTVRDSLGAEHPLVAASLGNLGLVMHRLGHDEDARAMLEDAIARKRKLVGDDHPDVAFAMNNLGEVYRELGRAEEALALHDAAAQIWTRHDPDHPYAAYPVANRGLDMLEIGRTQDALVTLREAMAICAARQADPTILAATRFGLAKAMIAVGEDRDAALAHARGAAATYGELGGRYELERERITTWLDDQVASRTQPGM